MLGPNQIPTKDQNLYDFDQRIKIIQKIYFERSRIKLEISERMITRSPQMFQNSATHFKQCMIKEELTFINFIKQIIKYFKVDHNKI